MPDEPLSFEDRRSEPRRKARGEVLFKPSGSAAVAGRLVDIAKSGFRAAHFLQTLRPGQVVSFEIAGFAGSARVVWTRILGDQVESGFLILKSEPA
jgi:hypothetical protein